MASHIVFVRTTPSWQLSHSAFFQHVCTFLKVHFKSKTLFSIHSPLEYKCRHSSTLASTWLRNAFLPVKTAFSISDSPPTQLLIPPPPPFHEDSCIAPSLKHAPSYRNRQE